MGNDFEGTKEEQDTRMAFWAQPIGPGSGQEDGFRLISLDGRVVFSKQPGVQLSLWCWVLTGIDQAAVWACRYAHRPRQHPWCRQFCLGQEGSTPTPGGCLNQWGKETEHSFLEIPIPEVENKLQHKVELNGGKETDPTLTDKLPRWELIQTAEMSKQGH